VRQEKKEGVREKEDIDVRFAASCGFNGRGGGSGGPLYYAGKKKAGPVYKGGTSTPTRKKIVVEGE